MEIDNDLRIEALDDLKTQTNSGLSFIDEPILSMMAQQTYDTYVPGFLKGWQKFKDDMSGEDSFSDLSEKLRAAMIEVATAKAGFSTNFAPKLIEALTKN